MLQAVYAASAAPSGGVVIATAAQGNDARAAIRVRAELLAQVADMHVEAAIVERQLAAQGELRQGLRRELMRVPAGEVPSPRVVGWFFDFALEHDAVFTVAFRERYGPPGPLRTRVVDTMAAIREDMIVDFDYAAGGSALLVVTVDGEVKHGVLEELWVEREGRDGMDPSMSWLSASSSPCSWQSEQWWEQFFEFSR